MTEATDRGAVAIDGIELAVVSMGEGRDVIEEHACVERRFRLQITEHDEGFASIPAARKQFPQ